MSVQQGFPTPPDAPAPFFVATIPVTPWPTGGYTAFGEVPLYMRMISVRVTGAADSEQLVISVRGVS